MLWFRVRLHVCLAALITNTASSSTSPNANRIFNAIHSSMRQWGSSLNHNGMSFFLASVPAGTQLYHGDFRSDPVKGPEWLAFEPEHALVFTHPFPHQPPPPGEGHPPPQQVFGKPDQLEDGFLHSFAAARDLRLLYIDGMSAAKTTNGTLDSQDRILFRSGQEDGGEGRLDDRKRAKLFCQMIRDRWHGRLDGMIRMEAGFEIVLCDFTRNLELLRVSRVRPSQEGSEDRTRDHAAKMWFPAAASRYWTIGGDRVRLNYDNFVTAYVYELDLFPAGENVQPRLDHLPFDELEPMRQDLDALILNHETIESSTNWQAVADMVVERYGTRVRYLASGQASTLQQLQDEIENIVTPFIDYDNRNTSIEVERCSNQFVRRSMPVTSVAADAVFSVSRRICASLLEALHYTEYESVLDQIQDLAEWLSWTTWKDCNGCGDHEICLVPMWPLGTVEDYKHPRCRDVSQLEGEGPRYWGGHGFPRRPKPTDPQLL
ncbi:hypothetical protein BJX61DRAFT_164727 [Aspergillus egyptiacus]|nr:hypothetical protein BJX61DRAFT_164727 [Aspergillus egyptiacus]